MTTPPTVPRVRLCWAMNWPKPLAAAPMAMNTRDSPMTKARPGRNTVFQLTVGPPPSMDAVPLALGRMFWLPAICSSDWPLMKHRYAGTSGRMHGLRKVRTPAVRAPK